MIRGLWMYVLFLSINVQAQITDFGKVDFHQADSIAALYKGEKLSNLPVLVYKLTASLSTKLEQFRAIYTWLSTNIDNDYDYYLKNKKKREQLQHDSLAFAQWNEDFQVQVFKKLLKEQKTVCTVYAYLLKELASFADIDCKIIDGYGRTIAANIGEPGIPNHSWNAVQLNNKWYLCDATWSSGGFNIQEKKFIRNYNDGYFLAKPELFVRNHYPLDTAWILMYDKPSLGEFLTAPLIYKSAFNYHITPVSPKVMKMQLTKGETITFLFKAPDSIPLDDIQLELISENNIHTVKPDILRTQEGLLALKYSFVTTGYYDVHIKIGDNYIVSYTIQVKKNKSIPE
ncbi:MAG: transglutaminase domain-containing protein [Microscillaceae bacterium]|nr:transglutaminase domain-containing protein [Microscillaceae bacterium]